MPSTRRLVSLCSLMIVAALTSPAKASPVPASFDWNPGAIGLNGGSFTADTARLSDYGQIATDSTTGSFSEAGYLPVLGFSLNGQAISPGGLNDPSGQGYGAYIRYQGTGTEALTPSGILYTYASLSYSLYGFNGLASYGLGPTGAAFESGGTDLTLLGDGHLIDGSLLLVPTAFIGGVPVQFFVSGRIKTTIADVPAGLSSKNFLGLTLDLMHLPGEIFPISSSVFEANGGSSSTATIPNTAIPEPASLLILGTGLLAAATLRRRK